jgi:hypothetical protein
MKAVKAYKLFRVRKDGSIGSLFINRKAKLEVGKWLKAENFPTSGFTHRPYWHCTKNPIAPHLSEKDRMWYRIEMTNFTKMIRPANQGGIWYLAGKIRIIKEHTKKR